MPLTTLGQETRWAYSTTLPSPHGAVPPGVLAPDTPTSIGSAIWQSSTRLWSTDMQTDGARRGRIQLTIMAAIRPNADDLSYARWQHESKHTFNRSHYMCIGNESKCADTIDTVPVP